MPTTKRLLLLVFLTGSLSRLPVNVGAQPDSCVPWELRSTAPSITTFPALAYDEARSVTILYGGDYFRDPWPNGEMWIWDGTEWLQGGVHFAGGRTGHRLVYDSRRRVTVLFGGVRYWGDSHFYRGAIEEWDGSTWTIRAIEGPVSRAGHAMAYDSGRGVMVVFGGYTRVDGRYTLLGDTWEFDGNTWAHVDVVGPSVGGGIMSYDSWRHKCVLYTYGAGSLPETWEWDGEAWIRADSAGSSPSYGRAMTFDRRRGVCVLFAAGTGGSGEMWEWNGVTWNRQATDGPSPEDVHGMAYDVVRDVTVLYTANIQRTAEWDGVNWRFPYWTRPSPRWYHAMAYDGRRGVTVLFGGYSPFRGDTWEWNGGDWKFVTEEGPAPRSGHVMAFDTARGVTVLFGGNTGELQGDTWEWDGIAWSLRAVTGPKPRMQSALAYDSARGVSVLFGGYGVSESLNDTWEWDGHAWATRETTAAPSPRFAHAMAYDERRAVTVLYGGNSSESGDPTWHWDGVRWRMLSADGPGLQFDHAMTYASDTGTILLFGFSSSPGRGPSGDLWQYDGQGWHRLRDGWLPHQAHAMAHDARRGRLVLFGGVESLSNTWEFSTCSADSDGDGLPDDEDGCVQSELRETVVIGDCDSGVVNRLFPDGCTMADRIGECEGEAGNHGEFVSCVAHWTSEWSGEGPLDSGERGVIQRCAAGAQGRTGRSSVRKLGNTPTPREARPIPRPE